MTKLLFVLLVFSAFTGKAQEKQPIVVATDKLIAPVSPTMWGVFFEDINFGADGGLYAELIKNRSFEFLKPLMGWTIKGDKSKEGVVKVLNRQESNLSNPHYLHFESDNFSKGSLFLINEGFRGMGIKQGIRYDFSMMYRQQAKGLRLIVELKDGDKLLGTATLDPEKSDDLWHKQQVSFVTTDKAAQAKLYIYVTGTGNIDLDMISLFPSDTWKGRPGGMRANMVQMLADLKPGFIRFPGGCIVEGVDLTNRYQWKKTIGPLEDRQLIMNRWNVEFSHRAAPDYFQTFGLGFYEYFQLAEDIGAEPVPILNCGMACQYNTAEMVPLENLGSYIQDALDLIEFANGKVTSEWGGKRAEMGHPEPFNMKYLGVGNENWGPQYLERAKLFKQAIKKKYPEVNLIFSSGTDPESERFHFLDKELRQMDADIIDEHYYRPPQWFLDNASRYDTYNRKGPKIFAGEYAAHVDGIVKGSDRNIWQAALAEAAFMTGLERNAGIVHMASYAPLFAHTDAWQWAPDLIWTDNLTVYGTPSYYVQKLFSNNRGTHVLPLTTSGSILNGKQDSLYVSAVIDTIKRQVVVKVVNASATSQKRTVLLKGRKLSSRLSLVTLSSDIENKNTLTETKRVIPLEKSIKSKKEMVDLNVDPYSLNLLIYSY